jgi:enoyl-CoA hydratase/carnithine racemase
MTTTISTRRDGRVGHVVLDGEKRLNALGGATLDALAAAVRAFSGDGTTRALVVTGSGRAFSAGADIREFRELAGPAEFARFLTRLTDTLDVLATGPLPVVAAINGMALGGGLELAMACDIRVAADTALLGLPEPALGAIPGAGGTQRLPRLVPPGIAREMLLLGEPVGAARAYEIGLVNRVCPADEVATVAAGMAGTLAAGPPRVHAALKALLDATSTGGLRDGIALERRTAEDLYDTADAAEGRAAFAQRRRPEFTGE